MLAGIVGVSILSGSLSVAVAIGLGMHPLLWPVSYWLAGFCAVLACMLGSLKPEVGAAEQSR